ncbi:PREDICTED: leucine-rich repeat receptor-like serine/threonine-protein kinase BAM3 isoform X1 [Nicotiana attenuata]|uniref:non-specific serine/threonine protein kinase n=1 Tax=Nicotiana attenuata TaxID=49451 RepID=A0A1J6IT41_NICAT|nr:PREDICTED: leucine-rich repeat receptor-like serine/threonine-protein kinase BAM3 isoform X1 [Nicotiana attenuata]OIT07882.1 leucine-rich repeat receptor-like serinethreonine-protein kinase bam3 [Nicotiana attenuata]
MAASATILFFFTYFLLVLLTSSQPHNLSLRRQAKILVSLKQDFVASIPSTLSSWNMSNYMYVCSWTGITCDDAKSVTSIDISNLNISGSLSLNIHELTTLQILNISNNLFSGNLSWEIPRLKALQVLDAYNNNFSGPLPLAVTQLLQLKHLDFGGNYFSGQIPLSYGTFNQLEFLSVAGNDLRGPIPRELGNLTNLRWLHLGYFNQFDEGIPPELGKLVNLVHLDLSSCNLDGPIPAELGNLNMLDTLFLQKNQLTGMIPPELGNLTSLKSLDLSINELTGAIPIEFSGLKKLTLLNLFINNFRGEIPQCIAELPELEVLNLWRNNFTGFIPSKLGINGKLVEIDLSSNRLTGLIPKSLCLGRNLRILILLNNFLFGPLPDDFGQCHSLSRVRMGQNYLSGSIPTGFLYLPELSLVELQNNYISGHLSNKKSSVSSKLEGLNLSNNRLSGALPSAIGKFSGLKNLLLSGNRFSGDIPSDISRLKSISKLDLSRNNFSGRIPPEIGNCLSLTYLDLSQNQLSGPIPVQISQIHILNYINISWNHFNDSLPEEIGSMKSLTSADFSHNNLTGSIPETGQYLYFNSTSFIGNPYLCGSYLTPCNITSNTPSQLGNGSDKKAKVPTKYKFIFAFGLLVCSLIFVVLAIIKTRKGSKSSNSWKLTAFQKLEFGSEDVLQCLKDNNIIGRGGAGTVYRATTPNGNHVAVKKLGISKGTHDNGLSAEVKTLGKIRHRYIVRLLAFCSNREMNLLVYEYMPNGSLGEVLHGKNGGLLQWDTRLKIAIEAAKGLSYLHHDCSPMIIHRDVKSNNILLNSELEAHVADFGLAKYLRNNGTSECMSAIAGSYGYIAPEYAYTLKIDEKSDVYSYGVVLLELITGRRPVGNFGEEGLDIVQWAKRETNWSKEGVVKILDERLKNVATAEAMQVFFVAMLCVEEYSVERPTMREVVQMLSQAKQPNTFQIQ